MFTIEDETTMSNCDLSQITDWMLLTENMFITWKSEKYLVKASALVFSVRRSHIF